MRVLVLCSGTGSVDRAFERRGWEVTSVDWSDRFEPSLCVDIMQWDYRAAFPQDHFQFVWASPDCTMFSIARTVGAPGILSEQQLWLNAALRSHAILGASGVLKIRRRAY